MSFTSIFKKTPNVFAKHKVAIAAGAVGLAGAAYGVHHGFAETEGLDTETRVKTVAHHIGAMGSTAAVLGAAGFLGRGLLKRVGGSTAKRLGSWYSNGMVDAMKSSSIGAALSHGPVGLTLGGVAGAVLGGGPGAAIGSVAGMVGLPIVRGVSQGWSNLGSISKTGILASAAVGAGVTSRAYLHHPSVEVDDVAMPDGFGGYTSQPSGLQTRLAALGGTGDVVLGLHNQRH